MCVCVCTYMYHIHMYTVLSNSVVSNFCDPMNCSLKGSPVHRILQARILGWVAMPSFRGSSQPRDQTQVFCTTGRFFTNQSPEKPKNTGVVSLSLLQGIFPTQELNQSLLHCSQILYQLSYQGSLLFHSVQFSRSVVSNSLGPHGLQHARPPCPSPTPRVYSNSCPLSW